MTDYAKKIFRGDNVIWMIFLFLCLISIVEVYSASSLLTFKTNYWQPIQKHTMFLLGGLVVVLLIHSLNPRHLKIFVYALPLIWGLLVATLFAGKTINEANRYLFGFQPSELAKLCLISTVAYFLSRPRTKISEKGAFIWMCVLTVFTCALIVKDNLSTAALLYGVILIMMFIGRVSIKRMSIIILATLMLFSILFAFVWFFPNNANKIGLNRGVTWVERIHNFNEKQDIKAGNYVIDDDNYQFTHAKIAVARGKIIGNMPGNSKQRDFLPQAYSDFIYAIIIEETGIIGGVFVLALYVFLFIRAGTIAGRCQKLFPKLLVMGCALMIVTQAFVNMAVSVGLIPVTGQPLPLVSKGGSSILVTCVYFGIILSVSRFENPRGIMQEEVIEEQFEEERRLAVE